MYNGVGLATVRGTATNGYVQKNLAHRPAKTKVDYNREMEKAMQKPSLGALSWPRACALAPPGTPRACARSPRGASVACRGCAAALAAPAPTASQVCTRRAPAVQAGAPLSALLRAPRPRDPARAANGSESGFVFGFAASKQPSQDILDHQAKRKIELKLMEFRLAMEDKGYDEDVIEAKVAEVRQKLLNDELKLKDDAPKKITDTHALAEAKKADAAKLANALGIRGDHTEGEAFDRDVQEQKRQQKREEHERRQAEWEARQRQRAKEEKEEEKRRRRKERERREEKSKSPARPSKRDSPSRSPARRDRSASPERKRRTEDDGNEGDSKRPRVEEDGGKRRGGSREREGGSKKKSSRRRSPSPSSSSSSSSSTSSSSSSSSDSDSD